MLKMSLKTTIKNNIKKENINSQTIIQKIRSKFNNFQMKLKRRMTKVKFFAYNSYILDEVNTCEFCEIENKDFCNPDIYDVHLWRECPMLSLCHLCN